MKLLVDTNIVIPLEPTSAELHANTAAAAELHALAVHVGAQLYVHPASTADLRRDRDEDRRLARQQLIQKYPALPDPPSDASVVPVIGSAPPHSNDWVDHQLLASLNADAVDALITEDRDIFRKARLLRLEDRVFTIAAAVAYLTTLFERTPQPPPAVIHTKAHTLDSHDPIFDSFRSDYAPYFDEWLRRCKREHRTTWLINGDDRHAAFAIVNEETNPSERIGKRTLKICSLKVADSYRGFRYGELLLKTVFAYADENGYEWIFVTVFQKYSDLIGLFEDFGFTVDGTTSLGELRLAKPTRHAAPLNTDLDSYAYNVRFGPAAVSRDAPIYIVPIQPRYSDILFPETAPQHTLFAGTLPFGNGIRKAYLCNGSIRSIQQGNLLCFYRSQSGQGIIATGVVERTLVSQDAEVIARVVGKRTVYSLAAIKELCRSEVLAILFRQSRILHTDVGSLMTHSVIKRAPQSIMRVRGGVEWLIELIAG